MGTKWAELRLIKRSDGTYFFELHDRDKAERWAGSFAHQPMTGHTHRVMGMMAEFIVEFELTGLTYEWKEPHERQGRADFSVRGSHGDVDIEVKACPHYGSYIVIEGAEADFDYVVGIKVLSRRRAAIRGYLPVKEVLGYPVMARGKSPQTPRYAGRPIPLSGLKPVGELWEILRA